jgi:SAM-dependent methyltransferase
MSVVPTVKQHYDELLGPVYSWILGDFETAYAANVDLFSELELAPAASSVAIDLGSGPGCQSIPLAELGYEVFAIDFCDALLAELRERSGQLHITTACDDLMNFSNYASNAELIVCMGDTLVHLPDRQTVERLISQVAAALAPGGRFIVTLRDYTAEPPVGADRFIPLRGNDKQVFTCFLEYLGDVINVHDLLHEKVGEDWRLKVSNYQKLLLDYRDVNDQLASHALVTAAPQSSGGMIVLQAHKPA